MKTIEEWVHFEYSAIDRERFREGELWRLWLQQYEQIFDEDGERIFAKQADMSNAGYKFFESLAAVRIFQEYGYRSLLEKYAQTKTRNPHKKHIVQ